ncbi:MAG: pyrroline-5-carboxylate reductase [Clostridia bacterium]|nr:pyrroline-5-carboxylate reductase [Clostridia bacterium]
MYKLGFIGCGNMATAIMNGAVKSGFLNGEDICVFDVDTAKAEALKETLGVNVLVSASSVAENSYAVVLAIKPQVFPAVLPQIKDSVSKNDTAIISIGAGKTLNYISSFFEDYTPVVRVMPNINAKVGASMSAVCGNENVDDDLLFFTKELCKSFGDVIELPESQFSIFGVIAGCSPAYAFMFIDSMARGAVLNGMSKEQALKISAQAVLGSAKMMLESEENPWALINSVCSPGGTTIEGIATLQKENFDTAVMNAVQSSYEKDKKL